jgi:hypothetical protein
LPLQPETRASPPPSRWTRHPKKVFRAINNVRGWWSGDIEGDTGKDDAEFTYRYQDAHRCRIKVTELVSGEKIAWHVLDNYFDFTHDKAEWKDTETTSRSR